MSSPARQLEIDEPSEKPRVELSLRLEELVRQGRLIPARSFTSRLPLPPALPSGSTLTVSEALDELRSED